jgi:hypothetical protein
MSFPAVTERTFFPPDCIVQVFVSTDLDMSVAGVDGDVLLSLE